MKGSVYDTYVSIGGTGNDTKTFTLNLPLEMKEGEDWRFVISNYMGQQTQNLVHYSIPNLICPNTLNNMNNNNTYFGIFSAVTGFRNYQNVITEKTVGYPLNKQVIYNNKITVILTDSVGSPWWSAAYGEIVISVFCKS
jgi:hypothetical protein